MLNTKLWTVAVASFAVLLTVTLEARAGDERNVWFWYQSCVDAKMALDISLDGTMVYSATFPICKRSRDATVSDAQKKILKFSFVPKRVIKWEGYLDENNATRAGQEIEGNVWQAGAEPDVLILGLSFSTSNQIYMNTLHIARTSTRNTSEIESGLTVTTYPVKE